MTRRVELGGGDEVVGAAGTVPPAVAGKGYVNDSGMGMVAAGGTVTERGGDDGGTIKAGRPGTGTLTRAGTGGDIAALLPVARAARDRLSDRGAALTRDTLAAQLRGLTRFDGHLDHDQVSRCPQA